MKMDEITRLQRENEQLSKTNRKLRTAWQLNKQKSETIERLKNQIKIYKQELPRQLKDIENLKKEYKKLYAKNQSLIEENLRLRTRLKMRVLRNVK